MSEAELLLREWVARNCLLRPEEVRAEVGKLLEDMARLRAFVDAKAKTEET